MIVIAITLAVVGTAFYLARPASVSPPDRPTAPQPPTNVRAISGHGGVTISWDSVAGATSYHIYRASAPGVTKEGYRTMPDGGRYENVLSPYEVTDLDGGKTYYFRVTAASGAGESAASVELSARVVAPPISLSPPTNVIATAGEGRIVVSWGVVIGASAYHLYRASAPGVTKEGYAAMPDGRRHENVVSPYTVTGLSSGKTYYFRVTAANTAGESDVSGEASATVPQPSIELTAPTDVIATPGEGRITVSWSPVPGALVYHLYRASVPGVAKVGYDALPDGARHGNVVSPYTVAGLESGRTYYFRVTAANDAGESDTSGEVSATPVAPVEPVNLYVTGLVELDNGAPAVEGSVTLRLEDGTASAIGATESDGRFSIGLTATFPDRVLVQVTYRGAVGPSATGFRWSPPVSHGGAVDVGRIVLPHAADKRMTMAGPTASSEDGAIVVTAIPPNVASLWARSYDPDAVPDTFPGSLAEGRTLPLNSVVFLWISALDASGTPVVDLPSPATVRVRVPETQWVDAVDLQPGNGVIDVPIYSMDYETAYWVREANGLLTDSFGSAIDESTAASIRGGSYDGEVYAQFLADHFSWWNVDYPPENCKPDFGDASDPPYPTTLARDGARHLNICRAWLGAWVDGEQDANAVDVYDDGLWSSNPLKVRVSNFDWAGSLYLNALIDENADGDWSDAGEWAIQNLPVNVPRWKGKVIETSVVWSGDTWLRLTLTGVPIEDYDGTGEFEIGETEDYPFLKYRLYVGVLGDGTVTSDPPGIDCRSTGQICAAEFLVGTPVKLTATPDPGRRLRAWALDCSGTATVCDIRMEEDRAVLATFVVRDSRLSVTVSGSGMVKSVPPGIECRASGVNCAADFRFGTSVDLTVTPDAGWTFDGWGGDCAGTTPTCNLLMDRDRHVTASFSKPSYRLSVWVDGSGTVTSVPAGIDCGSTTTRCSADFPASSNVDLTATPDSGESFLSWYGDCSGTNPSCSVLMDGDRSVVANFTSPPYFWIDVLVYGTNQSGNYTGGTVTSLPPGIDCSGNGTWGGTCSAAFLAGTNVTLTATPDPGYRFLGWGGDCTGTAPTCILTMTRNMWVVAYFGF